ncbi:MAG: bacillithiol system redox-active protein YtxJ [Planctomycetes bacterium]|nr:bacillithiol system redox-active protein YtxJ [Planctomycetota bacterium]
MPATTTLTDLAQWEKLWREQQQPGSRPLLIFKKSPICPTSHHVERTFNAWLGGLAPAAAAKLNVVLVDVVNQRPVSRKIAEDVGVVHQSPQALLLAPGGKVLWHASHGDVDEEALTRAAAGA